MRPKFEVGEEVILQSIDSPEKNGECKVLTSWFCRYINISTGEVMKGYLYKLTIPNTTEAEGWMESSLRKKHKPSRMSFGDLMYSLKAPITS